MTEARKEIIELISPFMDKTLSEGCYIYTECNNGEYDSFSQAMGNKSMDKIRSDGTFNDWNSDDYSYADWCNIFSEID